MGYPFICPIKTVDTAKIKIGKDETGNYKIPNYISSFEIENTHASQSLYVSFDGGLNYRTIAYGDTWSAEFKEPERAKVGELTIWGSGSATTFELVFEVL